MQYSQVYKEFYELHRDTYESIMRFYVHNRPNIKMLPLEEQLELTWQYLNACFQTADYQTYLDNVDAFVERLIIDQVDNDYGKEVYVDALFKRAASCYNLGRFKEAEHIIKQVCGMQPDYPQGKMLYRHCLYRNLSNENRIVRHAAGVGILVAAVLSGLGLFLDSHVSEGVVQQLNLGRNVVFAASMVSLVYIEGRIRWEIFRK